MPAKPMRAGRTEGSFHYREALRQLNDAQAPYLVGGTYAYHAHTRIHRPTKDLDLFVKESDRDRILEILHEAGWETTVEVPHWLAKARRGETFIDVIHSSGNGIASVDDLWFTHSVPAQVLGAPTRLVPVEEMLWSKAFVMEKYRFDGADVAHLLLMQGERINWDRLLWRFGRHWRVLLGHLLFFGFIYPEKRRLVPDALIETLLVLLRSEGGESAAATANASAAGQPSCRGTLLSRKQYRVDVEVWGFRDARLDPDVRMTERDIAEWTLATPGEPAAAEA
jgi:hypothetical protein